MMVVDHCQQNIINHLSASFLVLDDLQDSFAGFDHC
jgi:hypothetical protein